MNRRLKSIGLLDGAPLGGRARGKSFQLVLSEAVVSGLTEVLGSAGARAALYHLRLTQSANASEVHGALSRIFGLGTSSLESSILRNLYTRLGSSFSPEESMTFADHVAEARKAFSKTMEG